MGRYQELKGLVENFEKDFTKFFEKGNKSAGTRVRKAMKELQRKAAEIRKEVQEIKTKEKAAAGPPPSTPPSTPPLA